MLGQENIAWLTYSIIFSFITIVLIAQSIFYRHIIPFTLYAAIIVCTHIYLTFTPYYTQSDIPWRDQEPVLNQIPIVSILIFSGIINWQFVYLNFINTAYNNYKRWGTLHPVVITDIKSDDSLSEKSIMSNSSSTNDYEDSEYTEILLSPPATPQLLSKVTLWSYIFLFVLYVFANSAFLICILAINDPQTIALSSAICITLMSIPVILNFIAIVNTFIKCYSKELVRMVEQIRQDLISLMLMSFLFMIIIVSITVLAWIACFSIATKPLSSSASHLTGWIMLKAFLIYLPLILLFLCCIFKCKNLKLIYDNQQKPHRINNDV